MDPWGEFLSTIRIGDVGASALVVIIVLMILRGDLVPKSNANSWKDAASSWKDAFEKSQQAGEIKDTQISKLVDATAVVARALDALPRVEGGEPDGFSDTTETRRRRPQG